MKLERGVFTISLDFELYWGVRDKRTIDQYQNNLLGVRQAIPEMLRIFSANDIHATWAAVGFLFAKDLADLKKYSPKTLPTYSREELSPYKYINDTADLDPAYHFAPDLIDLLLNHDGQEVGTHTFSHYYCLESGQTLAQFEEDITAAIEIARGKGVTLLSLVFPRNQWNPEYLAILNKLGVKCYRGNEKSWLYSASDDGSQGKLQRAFRLIDAYINLSGYNTYDLEDCIRIQPFNFPASRFLRAYSERLAVLDGLKIKRIKDAMTHASINRQIFHMWWHPHNFGINLNRNLEILTTIVDHYNWLKSKYRMISMNMGELSLLAESNRGD